MTEKYRGFEIGQEEVASLGGLGLTQGYIRSLPYGDPLKARYGETMNQLRQTDFKQGVGKYRNIIICGQCRSIWPRIVDRLLESQRSGKSNKIFNLTVLNNKE